MMDHIQESSEYLSFFGLQQNPFPVSPDDANFYMSPIIEEIIAEIVHGVCARKGFILLTGEVGLGKTTITRRILNILEDKQVRTSLVFHTSLKDVDLLREINRDFGLPVDGADDGQQLGDQLQRLNDYLVSQYEQGRNCAIIIDDAQNLDRDSLELVRMISNLEVDQQKIVQILLVGQTELMATLNSRSMRQLASRIVIRKVVRSLTRDELSSYIQFKLNTSGNQGGISLTQPAFWRVFGLTRGNFRSVNLLMDRCLYAICHQGRHCITRRTVSAAHADLTTGGTSGLRSLRAVAASILLPLMMVMGAWGGHTYTSRQSMAQPLPQAQKFKVPEELGEPPESQQPAAGTPPAPLAVAPAAAAVEAFLSVYQLDRYSREFHLALKRGGLSALAQRIYGETGYQLIRLAMLPDWLRQRYGALTFALGSDETPTWLLFWKPRLELKRFYYAYQGQEVFKLQKIMRDLNLYHYKLDGIVGGRLINSVIEFQKQANLPVTGFPDMVTLFWVCHQEEVVANG